MEALLIYLLKSSGLIAIFYLAYHFLVRKETFFNSNRWFLLSGLFTAILLPLFFIKRVIWVKKPRISMEDLAAYSHLSPKIIQDVPVVEAFDWMQFIWISYLTIACVLVIRIVLNFTSLYRMLHKQHKFKRDRYTLIDLEDNTTPFSFFNYIVYNSDFYTDAELQSIILHEQIHSKERHSIDILVVKLFCAVFWFNPFVWLYKKAITQNLEYIADQKAIQQLDDRQAYQHALLKVVSHQNCLSITNHFYQSLIKKRIVMLNTHQSHQRKSWKYAVILPALLGFVLLFQIKVIAQEKENTTWTKAVSKTDEIRVKIDKNSSNEQLKSEATRLKEEHGVTLKISKVKRNTAGEITCIKLAYKDKNGNKGVTQVNGDEPIKPIHFYKSDKGIGFGQQKNANVVVTTSMIHPEDVQTYAYQYDDSIPEIDAVDSDVDIDNHEILTNDDEVNSKIVIKRDGKKALVIANGKIIEGDESILDKKQLDELQNISKLSDEEKNQIIVNIKKDFGAINADAMADAQVQIKRMGPQMKKQMELVKAERGRAKAEMERAHAEMERRKPEIERAQMEIEASKPELEKARSEMLKAKEEMLKAKAEMENAKAELEKARITLKKQKS